MKAGAPHPDISTLPKFIAVLKAGGGGGFTDPARGSATGKWVAELLLCITIRQRLPVIFIAGTPTNHSATASMRASDYL